MRKSWIAVTGMAAGMAVLAGCSDSVTGGGADDTSDGQAVSLASSGDVLRELGNLGSGLELEIAALGVTQSTTGTPSTPSALRQRARLAAPAPRAAPASTACSSGGTDTRTTDSKSRSFSYFSYNGPINYQLDAFSNCMSTTDGETDTINGSVESGQDAGSDMLYALLGTAGTAIQLSTTTGGASLDRSLLGTVEAQTAGSTTDVLRAVLQGASTLKQGTDQVSWRMSLGQGSTPFDVTLDSTAFGFNGPYTYTGSVSGCTGGNVTVATTTPLTEASGNQNSFSAGVITFSSGGKSVTVTVNSDGSATMSGSVSGTLSKDQFNESLLGATCVPLDTLGG